MERPVAIPALTGLRIVGALWVVLFHARGLIYETSGSARVFEPILSVGSFGVPLFFLLSGYLILHNYGAERVLSKPRELARFIWRRFARLWPVNVLALVISTPILVWNSLVVNWWGTPVPPWYSLAGWLGSFAMVTPLVSPDPLYPWNAPAWSLTAEMAAYFVFPLILLVVVACKLRRERLVWLPIAIVLAIASTQGPVYPYRWLVDLIITFAAGVALRLAGPPRSPAWVLTIAQILVPVLIVVACYRGPIVVITPLLAFWVWTLAGPKGAVVRVMTTRPFQIVGLSSYSLYMLHWPVLGYASMLLFYVPLAGPARDLHLVATIAVMFLAAWACWRYFETPARRSVNLWFERVWPGAGKRTASAEVLAAEAGLVSTTRPASD